MKMIKSSLTDIRPTAHLQAPVDRTANAPQHQIHRRATWVCAVLLSCTGIIASPACAKDAAPPKVISATVVASPEAPTLLQGPSETPASEDGSSDEKLPDTLSAPADSASSPASSHQASNTTHPAHTAAHTATGGVSEKASSLVSSLASSLGFGRKADSHKAAASTVASEHKASTPAKVPPIPGTPGSLAPIVEKLVPCVVNISTQQTLGRRAQVEMPQLPSGSALEQFFSEFFDGLRVEKPRKVVSLGSGFIIDPEGYIVTNNHVIAEADEITVILQDDTELKATIVGRDSRTDIAILKVKTDKKLPAVEWGDSSSAKVGDWVIAIGNPFGLGGTVTAGIISARARDISRRVGGVGEYVDDFIQTDASINVGNSGGPMFDMAGRVIGVNTAILSPNGANIGIGFALPSEVAKPVVEQVRKLGHVKRGWIGVYIQKLENDVAESLGLSASKGALVGKVVPGGPAEKAGFEHGDVVLTLDGHEINDPRKLTRLVGETPVGKKVPVKIWRHRKEILLSVTVEELKDTGDTPSLSAGKMDKATGKNTAEVLGMSLALMTPEYREQFGIKADVRGVLVTEVAPNSVAFRKGIRPGDVIMEAAQTPVNAPADVLKKVHDVKKEKGKSLLILLNRDDMLAYEALKLDGSADKDQD